MKNDIQLRFAIINVSLQVSDDTVTTTNRVISANVRLENDGPHCLVFEGLVKMANGLGNVADTKQLMGV